jgi:hypothetical protein
MMFNLKESAKRVRDAASLKELGTDDPRIEFAADEELFGGIPEPVPATNVLPEWYKSLEGRTDESGAQSTVKRCAPFLDALTMGWIIPLAGDVKVDIPAGNEINTSWRLDRDLVSSHNVSQVGGEDFPEFPVPIMKFHNYWAIDVPDGYSVLFTKPFNRMENRFQVFSGVVDCDHYYNYINFPFMWTDMAFNGVVSARTPLVQAIPFKRDGILSDAIVKEMGDEERSLLQTTDTKTKSRRSAYREEMWQPKDGSRNVPELDQQRDE